jgi:4-amino-4-deoxy-L-arabinose transferase-like glycosyltransferase
VLLLAAVSALGHRSRAPLYGGSTDFAEIGREMAERGDWLTPRFDYDRFLDKPPLQDWLVLLSYRLFGVTEEAARLPSALALVGCVGLTMLIGDALFGATTGCLAGLFLATTMGFSIYSYSPIAEPLLAFWITASLLCFWRFRRDPGRSVRLWLMYASLALGVLTKGLTALIFPCGVIALFLLFNDGFKGLGPLLFARGWLLVVLLCLPWHLWIAWHNQGYLWFYFVHEQVLRFMGARVVEDEHLSNPAFLSLAAAALFPWIIFLPKALWFHWRSRREGGELSEPALFVLLWAVVILGFFVVSKFKCHYYAIPAWPALMLLIAHPLGVRLKNSGDIRPLLASLLFLSAASAVGLLVLPQVARALRLELAFPWILEDSEKSMVILLVVSLSASLLVYRRRLHAALFCIFAMMLPLIAFSQRAISRLGPVLSEKSLAEAAVRCLATLPVSTPLVHVETREDIYQAPAVFYARRRIWLVMPRDKQVFPLGREFYLDPERFDSWWRDGRPVLLMGDKDRMAALLGGMPRFVLARSGGNILTANRDVCGRGRE